MVEFVGRHGHDAMRRSVKLRKACCELRAAWHYTGSREVPYNALHDRFRAVDIGGGDHLDLAAEQAQRPAITVRSGPALRRAAMVAVQRLCRSGRSLAYIALKRCT